MEAAAKTEADLRRAVVEAARACVGTPFLHQGRTPGVGLDCVGLVRWPQVALGVSDEDFRQYGPMPNPQRMEMLLKEHFVPISVQDLTPGDILWFKITSIPQHLAIYTGISIIHAVSSGPKCVVEHGYRFPWPKRVAGVFRYRWLEMI